ncbi:KAP family NTPase [Clostridium algoriphilum]|uniref:KAP family P-loop NTPase fold protein n=1 Tax=Clostridium algoriphilum TaxID=198347 RepID=UPI001CF31250|nr:P-loop NTPase fold protein [Clostridium algoriphilum]MCB2292437.1 KAP family NTPase [Clostridium algoriphilum]
MKLHKTIEIPEDNPFQNDKFHRKDFINNLMSVLSTYDSGLVLSIDSSWGTGKTTFVKMWETYLNDNVDFKPIYFNAWENDDSLDPLVPLISLMSDELSNENGIKIKDRQLYKIGAKIIRKGIPYLIKMASHGILEVPEISLGSDTEKEIEEYTSKIGETIFDDYKEKSSLKRQFKNALIEYQESINKKVVIFIDELDRCRPLYAIETLERIKHFFDLDNFIFILSMDKTQLSHSVSTIYGNGMDSIGYLRRFIDLEFTLPEPNRNVYFDYLISQYGLTFINIDYFWGVLKEISVKSKISLRDIDKLFINLNILIPTIDIFNKESNYKFICKMVISNIYVYLIILKIKNPNDYQNIIDKKYTVKEIERLGKLIAIDDIQPKLQSIDNGIMRKVLSESISKFLLVNLWNLDDTESYFKEINENRETYLIVIGDSSKSHDRVNIADMWNRDNPCPIIKNMMFTNNMKI